MLVKDLVDRLRQARNAREKSLRRSKAGALAVGVSIGCTLGAAAGILFAPKAGKETREEVGLRSREAWDKIKDNASVTGSRLMHAVEGKGAQARTAAGKCVDAAKEVLHEPVEQAAENNPR